MVKRQLKQKQKQSQSVNIYLGSRGKAKGKRKAKGKSKGRESSKPFIAPFNPSPIINVPSFNFPPNFPASFPTNIGNPLLPPPQRVAFPESQQAPLLNLNPAVPVPFKFEGAKEKLKAPAKEPQLVPEAKAEEEVVLPVDLPEEPPEEELSVSSTLTAPTVGLPTFENLLARNAVEGLNPPYVASSLGVPLSLTPSGFTPFAQSTPFFPVEASAEPKEEPKVKKQQKKSGSSAGRAGTLSSFFPSITPANPLSVITGEPVNFPPPYYSIPITTEKPQRTFTLGQPNPYSFLGTPTAPPAKEKGEFLQRQRGTGLTPAEETLLLSP